MLQIEPLDWNAHSGVSANAITANKQTLREACLLHYNLDLAAVQRFCGRQFTGKHHCTNQALQVCSHFLPDNLLLELLAALIDGVLNVLAAHIPNKELQTYFQTPNLKSANNRKELVAKAINKELVNHLSMAFDEGLTSFIPHIGVIKLSVVEAKNEQKKPRMFRHCGKIICPNAHLLNSLVSPNLIEPSIGYGATFKKHCKYLLRLAGTFLNTAIDCYNNDTSGALPQLLFHLDLPQGNISVFKNRVIPAVALHFGGNFGPALWEPIANTRYFIAG